MLRSSLRNGSRRRGLPRTGAGKLIENLLYVGVHRPENPRLENILVGKWQLMRHTLLLDGAIDR
eukprot:1763356-Heterocapsa_arctica.AAC.1